MTLEKDHMVDIANFPKDKDGNFITTYDEFAERRESPHLDFIDSSSGKKPKAVLRSKESPTLVIFDLDGKILGQEGFSEKFTTLWHNA